MSKKLRIGLIGFGEIARVAVKEAGARDPALQIVAALVRKGRPMSDDVPSGCAIVFDVEGLIAHGVQEVFECAGHEAVETLVEPLLRAGLPVSLISTGALTNDALTQRLKAAATAGQSRLSVLPGALAGLEALSAARLAGLDAVCHRITKPRSAWAGMEADTLIPPGAQGEVCEFFRGSSREAATRYPRNANTTAAIALAGVGLDRTETVLAAGPEDGCNVHELTARGAFGSLHVRIVGTPLPRNSKTSMLAALSVARAMLNLGEKIAI